MLMVKLTSGKNYVTVQNILTFSGKNCVSLITEDLHELVKIASFFDAFSFQIASPKFLQRPSPWSSPISLPQKRKSLVLWDNHGGRGREKKKNAPHFAFSGFLSFEKVFVWAWFYFARDNLLFIMGNAAGDDESNQITRASCWAWKINENMLSSQTVSFQAVKFMMKKCKNKSILVSSSFF